MYHKQWWIGILLVATVLLLGPTTRADEKDPLPAPQGSQREQAIRVYNEGVTLLRAKHYAAAQEQFEQALRLDETLAEAHNNLAFSLRQQGLHNATRALQHYQRAIELKPDLAQAYIYRGVLFIQLGDLSSARADHAKLERLIAGTGGSDKDDGLAGPYD